MKATLIAPRRYIQGGGVLAEIGPNVKRLGKKAFALWSPRVKGLIGETVAASLKEAGVELADTEFGGETTKDEARRVAKLAKEAEADVIIGAGGGKCMDTAKGAAVLNKANRGNVGRSTSPG